jgi:hypothetical protein
MVLWRKRENGQKILFEDGLVEAGKGRMKMLCKWFNKK